MDSINLDNLSQIRYTDSQLLEQLESLVNEHLVFGEGEYLLASGLIRSISDRKALNRAISLMSNHGVVLMDALSLLPYDIQFKYSAEDLVRIEAAIYSVLLSNLALEFLNDDANERLFRSQVFKSASTLPHNLPELQFTISNRELRHNSDEVERLVMKKNTVIAQETVLTLPIESRKAEFSKLINHITETAYAGKSFAFFREDIDYLKALRDQMPEHLNQDVLTKSIDEQSGYFKNGGFYLWKHIMGNYVPTHYGRSSAVAYFYQLMSNDKKKFIWQPKGKFLEWYNEYYSETIERLKSFTPKSNSERERQYSLALDWLKSQNLL